ncbi:MAG: hypothetical protein R2850_03860 [Bacteroidia bacterium]
MSREEAHGKTEHCAERFVCFESRNHVVRIREACRNAKNESSSEKEKYLENGGTEEDFEVPYDHTDEEFKALQDRFRELAKSERKREKNLKLTCVFVKA